MAVITTISFENINGNAAYIINGIGQIFGTSGYKLYQKDKGIVMEIKGQVEPEKMNKLIELKDNIRKGGTD